MKNKKYQTVGTILKSNIKIVERDIIDTPNTQVLKPKSDDRQYNGQEKKDKRTNTTVIDRRCIEHKSHTKILKINIKK
jgi:hypothetical protein